MDVKELSKEELKAELERREAKEKKDAEKAKQKYEGNRDDLVKKMCSAALYIHQMMKEFKSESIQKLDAFYEQAKAYGDVRSTSKGGFSLRTSDGEYKVSYDRNTQADYDERADIAEQQLREFLKHMVKKRDKDSYELITLLLERGKSGKFNPANINQLIKEENRFNDPRWVKAIQLFKESHEVRLIAYSVSFYTKNADTGKDEVIKLSLPSIPTINEQDDGESNADATD
ncbi:DUF3164 family protein [Marinifilum flexuosum]|uniref:Uncharacterized protein DUF3164 n=1 Tax=Marinifilum flexuosum TaxID=1117708 RepID=A0A419X3K4_9BACT|nr:DUF3164 family protein [Marinifilum flexuosum]RKE02334.1 uncharacterized protein DUF3164 [Marinifilum flexuosum]